MHSQSLTDIPHIPLDSGEEVDNAMPPAASGLILSLEREDLLSPCLDSCMSDVPPSGRVVWGAVGHRRGRGQRFLTNTIRVQ